jgi:hypothetical protein
MRVYKEAHGDQSFSSLAAFDAERLPLLISPALLIPGVWRNRPFAIRLLGDLCNFPLETYVFTLVRCADNPMGAGVGLR